jgi:hypothetical protein
MESVSELESVSSSMMPSALEELGERMSTSEPSALERMTTLLSHRIVRVISIVEPLSQFWFREDLVRLVNGGHLGF